MSAREWWSNILSLALAALIAGVLLAAGVAAAADEIVLGSAISQTGKYAREGKFCVDAYTLTVDAVNKAGGVKVGGKTYQLALKLLRREQDVATAFDLASTGYVLENGRVVLSGPTTELRVDPHVKKAYLEL